MNPYPFCGSNRAWPMVEAGLQFNPPRITDAEFRRSNVFVAWSGKAEQRVRLIGPTQYDAWLLIEFDRDVAWFCGRLPITSN